MYYAPTTFSRKSPACRVLGYFVVVGAAPCSRAAVRGRCLYGEAREAELRQQFLRPARRVQRVSRNAPAGRARAARLPPLSLAAETTGAAPAAEPPHVAAAPEVAKPAKQPQRKVVVHKQRQPRQEEEDWFGNNNRRDFAKLARSVLVELCRRDRSRTSREREPSWRDSWASGSFDQRRERGSRRASRQNNDFWFR